MAKALNTAPLLLHTNTNPWLGWLPVIVLPATAIGLQSRLPPWVFMWLLAFAIFAALKWLTWWQAHRVIAHPAWRSAAYLLAWPGMDASAFLNPQERASAPQSGQWGWAIGKTALGIALIWLVARFVPTEQPLIQGWIAMFGLILLLHFGTLELLALIWQAIGVKAQPIMAVPIVATSLSEFWGKRWNLGFRQLSYELLFRPLQRLAGIPLATLAVFVASGLIHDLVISVPAQAGYGLPTGYFTLQGFGVLLERSQWGKRMGLNNGLRGRIFLFAMAAGPVFWLFHPPFVLNVIVPFMRAVRAL